MSRWWPGSPAKANLVPIVKVEEEPEQETLVEPRQQLSPQKSLNKLRPIIHWDPEPSILYPEPLSFEKHFVALCKDYKARTVDGNFLFDPVEGTVLEAGEHELTVNFVPLKSFKYLSASASRRITVEKRKPVIIWENPLFVYGSEAQTALRLIKGGSTVSSSVINENGTGSIASPKLPLHPEFSRSNTANSSLRLATDSPNNQSERAAHSPTQHKVLFEDSEEGPETHSSCVRLTDADALALTIRLTSPSGKRLYRSTTEESIVPFSPSQDSKDPLYSRGTVPIVDPDYKEERGPSDRALFATTPVKRKLTTVETVEDSTLPVCNLLYGTMLQPCHFEGVVCELTEGQYFFSHKVCDFLEIGKHTITVQYEPSEREKRNFHKTYASYFMVTNSNRVEMQWPLDADALNQLVYPAALPPALFTAAPCNPEIEGPIVYYPEPGAVLSAGVHTLTAEIRPVDFQRHRVSQISVQIEIKQCPVECSWTRPVAYFDGDLLDSYVLKATNTLKLPAGSYLPKGLHDLTVEFVPDDDNYEHGFTSTKMRILPKRVLTLYWPTPFDLVHPDPLTRAQLNACITGMAVKGEWKFDPPLGTVLDAGTHKLQATFYPVKASIVVGHISTTIEVAQCTSRLYWPEPDSLLDGEAIFEGTLNCRVTNVPCGGTFKYTPPKGTSFKAGEFTLHVHFTPEDAVNYTEAELSVKLLVREKSKVMPKLRWPNPVCPPILYNTQLLDSFMNPVCINRIRGDFHFDPPVGTRLPCGEHLLRATFYPFDINLFTQGEFIESTITVVKASPVVVWEPAESLFHFPKALNAELHLNAHCVSDNIQGTFTYSPPVDTILEAGEHSLQCVFTPSDRHNFFDIHLSTVIFIRRGTPVIAWPEPAEPLVYPTYLSVRRHLNPYSVNPEVTGVFKFNHEQGTVLNVGTHVITCRFYPNDIVNYMSSDLSITITVVKGVPSVIWLPEFILIYETPLNHTQHCNAKIELKGGTFIYDPPLGTILPASEKTKFSMHYIPADTFNYHEVQEVRYLRIDRKTPTLAWELPVIVDFGEYLSEEQLCARLSETENSEHALEVLQAGSFKYNPTFGSTPPASVSTALTVVFTPPYDTHPLARNYCEATKEVNICVRRSRPMIVWKPRYLNIVEGQPLTEAQINARLEKPQVFRGVLAYNHNIGDILPPGRYKIECEFVSDEPHNTLPASMTIAIEILKKPPKIVWEVDPISGQLKSRKIIEK